MTVEGIVSKIKVQKDNDWGVYQVDLLDKKRITAVGVIPSVTLNMRVIFDGSPEKTQYGEQIKITNILKTYSDSTAGLREFLGGGYIKYMGPKQAGYIVDAFGKSCLDMFETESGRQMLTTVPYITENFLNKILPFYEENKKYKDIVLFLNGVGTINQVKKIYEKYGDNAVKELKKNPYILQKDLEGIGFKKADEIALGLGIKRNSIYRVSAAIYFILDNASQSGHIYLNKEDAKTELAPLLIEMPKIDEKTSNISKEVLANAIQKWTTDEKYVNYFIKTYKPSEEIVNTIKETALFQKEIENTFEEALEQAIDEGSIIKEENRLYTSMMHYIESNCAQMITSMLNKEPVRNITEEAIQSAIESVEKRKSEALGIDFKATEEQIKAVHIGTQNRLAIVSGGPGRGKTAISEIIAQTFISSGLTNSTKDIVMLAPTGRAAKRITESTGYDAMTAHRMISAIKSGRRSPLKDKLILCDESSMIDIFLMQNILKISQDCNLILVGDVDQIASVGPGMVLKDMIDSGVVPYILLKQGHRNSGTIATNSVLINSGEKINKYTYDDHFKYTPCTKDNIGNVILKDYFDKVKIYGIKDVMCCVAMRDRGPACVKVLNNRIQEAYTRGMPEVVIETKFGKNIFRVGDRVMQTVNNYNRQIKRETGLESGVFNGEKGTIAKITPDPVNEYNIIVVFDDGGICGYTKSSMSELTLAYVTTIHKCQGSEAPCVLMAYTYSDFILFNKSLFYTGETRAKKEFCFYGEEKEYYGKMVSAFDMAVKKEDDTHRNTTLKQRIKELQGIE